ncbi:aminoglycoside phosphotransferase family protein [Aspergillus melleus]|uniref:aminoglycoside phosphotransferase family protein n=1 Tax=Aspergillus melleus TaxID=138277 RepID=UPI001E8D106B|nr:uncharacterized protein LDX57_012020 [Aspergillus melleus]KAH8434372.1 hypothetical protein LDX57_012020 [Aspergillus melleus]
MRPLLEAFLSSDVVATLTRLLHKPANSETYLKNVLLLPPSIHKAFRAGHVDIRPRLDIRDLPYPRDDDGLEHCVYGLCTQWPEEVTGLYLGDGSRFSGALDFFELSTTDTQKLPPPSNFLLNIHFRFATALHMFYIEDKVARGWPSKSMSINLPQSVISGFFSLWRLLPTRLRAFCYTLLNMLGRRLYPLEANVWAQRLPFGLYMKQCTRSPRNEPNVLKLLEKHTTVPAPRLLDTWTTNGVTNILMTRMPGQTLGSVAHLLSYAERDALAADIRDALAQLRSIPNSTPYLIADTLGGAITDHRIPDDTGGPFTTEAAFNAHLTSHLSITFEQIVRDNKLPYREHKLFPLTHSDFHHSNILLGQGRLSGIVDWESAGFKPEYWEFTKAMYCLPPDSVLGGIWRGVWGTQYEEELGIERRLWRVTPFGV